MTLHYKHLSPVTNVDEIFNPQGLVTLCQGTTKTVNQTWKFPVFNVVYL